MNRIPKSAWLIRIGDWMANTANTANTGVIEWRG